MLNACLNEFDRTLAETADHALEQCGAQVRQRRVRGYRLAGHQPVHRCGAIIRSQLSDWNLDKEALIDEDNAVGRIVPAIMKQIEHSAFVVCNLTGMRHTVLYEFGYAEGLHKPVVLCAHEGTTLPFDVHDHPTVFWAGVAQFRNDLSDRIKLIAREHGRS
jgi:hypothetical protein